MVYPGKHLRRKYYFYRHTKDSELAAALVALAEAVVDDLGLPPTEKYEGQATRFLAAVKVSAQCAFS